MTIRDMQRSIEPGSLEQGTRGELESGLSAALSGQEQAAGPVDALGGGSPVIPEDPLGALLSGEIEGNPDSPVTDGLSVGAGAGPGTEMDVMMMPRAEKVRQLAQSASSPSIRAAARNELRRMAREGL
jgi:hypothetical protein